MRLFFVVLMGWCCLFAAEQASHFDQQSGSARGGTQQAENTAPGTWAPPGLNSVMLSTLHDPAAALPAGASDQENAALNQPAPDEEQETPVESEPSDEAEPLAKFHYVVVGKALLATTAHLLKSPTAVLNLPQSLSIVTAEQIDDQGFSEIGQLADYMPGVNTTQAEGNRDALIIRGSRNSADFYVDGVRDDAEYNRTLYNLEQVELLRGPNALLSGRGGAGGILNRFTKKGRLGETFTGYRTGVDSFGEWNARLDSNLALLPNTALRINAFYESLENHRDFFEGDRIGINPTLRLGLSSATTLDLSYEYS
ncbi:TonB-dependent receptor plug domain-containing protein [Acanthopleuribacter pedis]|uniref:TonB-dependent receptor plug domain-containing protein n=1 Tax=Acanthopleuribacter pedis TaxID=442870 RepID=A0A8J7QG15_9BACT|nr:TonB-dependent receptor plug domain-containing protein [Acanthopleuribacter pedis]MBO1323494.1 TonB-dependent receptor plug domain-containing protein [Acanthopleuribacter pedis]